MDRSELAKSAAFGPRFSCPRRERDASSADEVGIVPDDGRITPAQMPALDTWRERSGANK